MHKHTGRLIVREAITGRQAATTRSLMDNRADFLSSGSGLANDPQRAYQDVLPGGMTGSQLTADRAGRRFAVMFTAVGGRQDPDQDVLDFRRRALTKRPIA